MHSDVRFVAAVTGTIHVTGSHLSWLSGGGRVRCLCREDVCLPEAPPQQVGAEEHRYCGECLQIRSTYGAPMESDVLHPYPTWLVNMMNQPPLYLEQP